MGCRELIILGTSSQVPTRDRNHGGYLFRWDGRGILVDPGEGTQRQFLFAGVPPPVVTTILVTHFHGDHCLGLAAMLQRLSLDGVSHPVDIFFPETGTEYLYRMQNLSMYRNHLEVRLHPLSMHGGSSPLGNNLELIYLPLDHTVDTLGYRLQEPDGFRFQPALLERLGLQGVEVGKLQRQGYLRRGNRLIHLDEVTLPHPGQAAAIILDTRPCEQARSLAEDADVLLIEATFLDEAQDKAHEYGHLTMRDASSIARASRARTVVFTHFSQRYTQQDVLEHVAEQLLPGAIVASDLQCIVFGPHRRRQWME